MTAEHFDGVLDAFQSRRPFQPFTVVLVDGDRFEVDFAKALVFLVGVAVYIGPRGVPVIFDHEGVAQLIGELMNVPESAA